MTVFPLIQRHEQLYPGCCGQDFYIDITFKMVIRRKTLFYNVNLVIPCMLIGYLIPFNSDYSLQLFWPYSSFTFPHVNTKWPIPVSPLIHSFYSFSIRFPQFLCWSPSLCSIWFWSNWFRPLPWLSHWLAAIYCSQCSSSHSPLPSPLLPSISIDVMEHCTQCLDGFIVFSFGFCPNCCWWILRMRMLNPRMTNPPQFQVNPSSLMYLFLANKFQLIEWD